MKPKRLCSIVSAFFLGLLMLFSTTAKAAERAAAALFVPANYLLIRGGEFTMGSPVGEAGRAETTAFLQKNGIAYRETQHQVRLSDFYMGKYAVTVGEFRKFVDATGIVNPTLTLIP